LCYERRRQAVQTTQATVFKRIGMMMRLSYDEVAQEQLPQRWVDLINYLNANEQAARSIPPPTVKLLDKVNNS
jgi:hypothetical protein